MSENKYTGIEKNLNDLIDLGILGKSNETVERLADYEERGTLDNFYKYLKENNISSYDGWQKQGGNSVVYEYSDKLVLYLTRKDVEASNLDNLDCLLQPLKSFDYNDFKLYLTPKITKSEREVTSQDMHDLHLDCARKGLLFFDITTDNVTIINNTPIITDRNSMCNISDLIPDYRVGLYPTNIQMMMMGLTDHKQPLNERSCAFSSEEEALSALKTYVTNELLPRTIGTKAAHDYKAAQEKFIKDNGIEAGKFGAEIQEFKKTETTYGQAMREGLSPLQVHELWKKESPKNAVCTLLREVTTALKKEATQQL